LSKKNDTIIVIVFVSILVLLVIILNSLGVFQFIKLFSNEISRVNYRNSLSEQYKTIDSRLQYFSDYKEKFQTVVDFLDSHNYIVEISTYSCINNLYEIKLNKNLYVCSNRELDSKEIEYLNNNIVKIYYDLNLDSLGIERKSATEIRFNLISTTSYAVLFDYCKNGACDMEYELKEMEDGTYREKSVINDEWLTIYRNIPVI